MIGIMTAAGDECADFVKDSDLLPYVIMMIRAKVNVIRAIS